MLVEGEPGIGKTWLLRELESEAQKRGALAYWGRSWEGGGAPGYWPWIQVFRSYLRDHDVASLVHVLGGATGDLAGLLPELAERLGVSLPPAGSEPEQARFRLFDSVAQVLRSVADARPLVLLLDDLHCADGDSLLLLEFIAAHLAESRLLVVGTRRSGEPAPFSAFATAMAALLRLPHTRHFTLRGLAESDVAAWLKTVFGPVSPRLAAAVHQRSDGNPLFVAAMLPHLGRWQDAEDPARELARLGVPDSVRAVIATRIARLPSRCREVLQLASVIGRDVDLAVLREVGGLTRVQVERALEPARGGGLVLDSSVAGRFRFSHVLVRDAVYQSLPLKRRLRLHRDVGLALEGSAPDVPEYLAAAAHHLLEAASDHGLERALDVAQRAAGRAIAQHSYDAALGLLERALAVLPVGDAHRSRRCELLLALGEAQRLGGRVPAARESFERGAELAREIGSAPLLARAALGVAEPWTDFGRVDELRVRLLEQALAALGTEPNHLRLRVLARLAPALHGTGSYDRMLAMIWESVEGARRIGDRTTLLYALSAGHLTMRGPAFLFDRKDFAREARALAAELGDTEMSARARFLALADCVEEGDLAGARLELEAASELAKELRQPRYLWQVTASQAALAILHGRFADAERLAGEARVIGERGHVELAEIYFVGQLLAIFRARGQAERLVELAELAGARYSDNACIRLVWAIAQLQLGKAELARGILEREVDDDLARLPQDIYWLFTMGLRAELCAALGDAERARRLYAILAPYEDRLIVLGSLAASDGSAAHALGVLAVAAGDVERGEEHLRRAIEVNQRIEAWPGVARAQCDYGRLLLTRGAPEDHLRGLALLEAAERAAAELEMAGVAAAARVARDRSTLQASSSPVPARNEFRLEGEYFLIRYARREVRLKRAKGLDYIAALLVHAGREVHALDLSAGTTIDGLSNSGIESLDLPARASYRRRLADVRDELAEAERCNDIGRSEVMRREMDFLTQELFASRGLSGRPRRTSDSERARVRVRNDIARALRTLGEHHPELWQHLSNALRTGTFCTYRPEHSVDWRL